MKGLPDHHAGDNEDEKEINVLILVKEGEIYIFHFTNAFRAECLRVIGRFASDPELSFTWCDAAILGHRVIQCGEHTARPDMETEEFKPYRDRESDDGDKEKESR